MNIVTDVGIAVFCDIGVNALVSLGNYVTECKYSDRSGNCCSL